MPNYQRLSSFAGLISQHNRAEANDVDLCELSNANNSDRSLKSLHSASTVPAASLAAESGQTAEGSQVSVGMAPYNSTLKLENTLCKPPRDQNVELSWINRLGRGRLLMLLGLTAVLVSIFGFISFLWFADDTNRIWHQIMIREWANRAVSISSLAMRICIGLQGAVGAAMLASIVLEAHQIRLANAAEICMLRSGLASPWTCALHVCKSFAWTEKTSRYSILALLLLCSGIALQFTSTMLLSDLGLGSLPGLSNSSPLKYDFLYQIHDFTGTGPGGWTSFYSVSYPALYRLPTWLRNPPAYPTFAEYSEPVPTTPDVDDTGVLLRAFLPFSESGKRETIRNYTGEATVLDARVSCQRPLSHDLQVTIESGNGFGNVTGTAANSTTHAKLLVPDQGPYFACSLWTNESSYSICQLQESITYYMGGEVAGFPGNTSMPNPLNPSGGLLSEFSNMTASQIKSVSSPYQLAQTWGSAYLIIKPQNLSSVSSYQSSNDDSFHVEERNEWMDLILDDGRGNVSVSLCYAAGGTASLPVEIHGDLNRTEPMAEYDFSKEAFTFTKVLEQLSPREVDMSHTRRNIMTLRKTSSWIPSPRNVRPDNVQYFSTYSADISGRTLSDTFRTWFIGETDYLVLEQLRGNWTALLFPIISGAYYSIALDDHDKPENTTVADPTLAALFIEAIRTTGSIAFAMSSMITVLSSMAYYDQFPQFNQSADVQQTFFTIVQFPQAYRGFVAVGISLLAHLLLIGVITILFIRETRYTLLGESWQAVAQIIGPETQEILEKASMAMDADVKRWLKEEGKGTLRVGISRLKDEQQVRLMHDEDAEDRKRV